MQMHRYLAQAAITLLSVSTMTCITPEPLPDRTLQYQFAFTGPAKPSVEVSLTAEGGQSGSSLFKIQESWAGVADTRGVVRDVVAFGEDGRPLDCYQTQSHGWEVFHQPGERLTLRYRLTEATSWVGNDTNLKLRLDEKIFHMIGHVGLLYPADIPTGQQCRIRVGWSGFEEHGWKVVSSFSADQKGFERRASLGQLLHSVFVAGDLRLYPVFIEGNLVQFAIQGSWKFTDTEFINFTRRVIQAQRDFFDDHSQPYFLVALTQLREESSLNMGGTGLTDSFALYVGENNELADGKPGSVELRRLVAHELFHNWNGGRLLREAPEEAIYWFSEGFTDFYSRRLLRQTGLMSREEYADSLSRLFAEYLLSPVNTISNRRIAERYWLDRHVKEVPYQRGDIVALLLDREIRRRSGGTRSLDDLMRQIVVKNIQKGEGLDTERLLSLFAGETSQGFADTLRRTILEGVLPNIPSDLAEPEAVLERVPMGRYELGFDFESSRAARRVVGVDRRSRAYAAGLRDGQRLLGWSLWQDDVTRPVVLTVLSGRSRRKISYLPQSSQTLPVPTFRPGF